MAIKIFKIKNRKGFAAICSSHLTEGKTKEQAREREQSLRLDDIQELAFGDGKESAGAPAIDHRVRTETHRSVESFRQ